jgi:hypothetical protein
MKYEFFGCSDDLFCVSGDFLEEQDDCSRGELMSYALFDVNSKSEIVLIHGQYANNGDCWTISIEPVDEQDLPLKGWSFEYNPKDYGCQLTVTTPDDIHCRIYES